MAKVTVGDLKKALNMLSDEKEIMADYMTDNGDLVMAEVYSLEVAERFGKIGLVLWTKEKA